MLGTGHDAVGLCQDALDDSGLRRAGGAGVVSKVAISGRIGRTFFEYFPVDKRRYCSAETKP